MKQFFATLWKYWEKFGEFIGIIIGRLFLMVFYFTVVLPFGVGLRLFGDPLRMRGKGEQQPTWVVRSSTETSLEAGYNQF